jgi:DNA-binding SARP family transcriptional activator
VRFGLLGPLSAENDRGEPIRLARPADRATLAALLLQARTPATSSALAEAIWGEHPPAGAEVALRVRISELRRVLADDRRIQTHPAGYRIAVAPGELDADVFRACLTRARSALDAADYAAATESLRQARALWRDPPLADVPDTGPLRGAVARLLQQRRDALEWQIDAGLALGQHRPLIAEIRGILESEPLAEHAHVQLMLALYRSGHKAAALDAYTRLRQLTAQEFGQDPGPEAQQLLRRILGNDPALNSPPSAARAAPAAGLPHHRQAMPRCRCAAPGRRRDH